MCELQWQCAAATTALLLRPPIACTAPRRAAPFIMAPFHLQLIPPPQCYRKASTGTTTSCQPSAVGRVMAMAA
ncbi:unnamed protein product, partial [Ceratitis capitata]